MQMVHPGEGTEDTRQVATKSHIRPENWPLVVRLANERLIVSSHDEERGEDTIELIHEGLIRYWQPLRQWLREDRVFRLWQNNLRQALAEWERTGKDDGALLAGLRLAEAEKYLEGERERLTDAEVSFVTVSLERRDAEQAERDRQRRELEEMLVEANHNFALALNERANLAIAQGKHNAAYLYLLNVLAKAKPDWDKRPEVIGQILARRLSPLVFMKSCSSSDFDLSPDGRSIASVTKDYDIEICEVQTGRAFPTLSGHTDEVDSIAFSPNGRILASGSKDRTARLWDMNTGKTLAIFEHSEVVSLVQFSPNGSILVSGMWSARDPVDRYRFWDVITCQPLVRLEEHTDPIWRLAFSPDGTLLASFFKDKGTIRICDVATGRTLANLDGHKAQVWHVAFSPDGKVLASSSLDNKTSSQDEESNFRGDNLRLWEVATGKLLATFEEDVNQFNFSPNSKILASCSEDNGIRLREVTTCKLLATLEEEVLGFKFSLDGKILFSASRDDCIHFWEVATDNLIASLHGSFHTIQLSPDGKILATTSSVFQDRGISLWEIPTGKLLATLDDEIVSKLTFSQDGKTLFSSSWSLQDFAIRFIRILDLSMLNYRMDNLVDDGNVIFSPDGKILVGSGHWFDVATNKHLETFEGKRFRNIAFSSDSKILAYSEDNIIHIREMPTGNTLMSLEGHSKKVNNIAFSPDIKILASGADDNTIRLWDVITGKTLAVLDGPDGPFEKVFSVTFSPNGNILASKYSNNIIGSEHRIFVRLWDMATCKPLETLEGYSEPAYSLAFSPNGKMLAVSYEDNNVINLWELATGKLLFILDEHSDHAGRISFSPDSRVLASVSNGYNKSIGSIRLWDIATGKPQTILNCDAYDFAFSPDGKILAVAPFGKRIRLWDVATRKLIAILVGRSFNYVSTSFSPNGKTLVSISDTVLGINDIGYLLDRANHTINYWDLKKLAVLACEISNDQLVKEEFRFGLHLEDLDLKPLLTGSSFDISSSCHATWSQDHPNHWITAAGDGDTTAMVRIGLIYDRSNDNDRALNWYRRAAAVGDREGVERLAFLEDWLKRQELGTM